jgi:hypothetical protein
LRKSLIALAALVTMLVVVPSAFAINVYTVSGNVNGRAGTSAKPVPISLNFGYTVSTDNGNRPSPVEKYSIKFDGLRVNSNVAATCRIAASSNTDRNCSSASRVGQGFIRNATGNSANPADRSITCNAALRVYNAGRNRATIFVQGSPSSTDPRTKCAIELSAPIPANFVRSSTGTALEFRVPQSLLHPAPGLDNAVESVTSTIRKITRRVNGRTRGFFESVGGCRAGRRAITVTFTPETGNTGRAQRLAPCRR